MERQLKAEMLDFCVSTSLLLVLCPFARTKPCPLSALYRTEEMERQLKAGTLEVRQPCGSTAPDCLNFSAGFYCAAQGRWRGS